MSAHQPVSAGWKIIYFQHRNKNSARTQITVSKKSKKLTDTQACSKNLNAPVDHLAEAVDGSKKTKGKVNC